MIDYICPECGAAMSSPDSLAGKTEICQGCGVTVAVPAPAAADPPAAPKQAEPAPVPKHTPQHTVMDHVVGIIGILVVVLSLWGFSVSETDLSVLICVVGFIGGWILVALASIIGLLKD